MERDEIVLIGPVCVGKTTVGRVVAERLGVPFTDIDDLADAYRLTCAEFDPDEWERLDAESYLTSYRYAEMLVVDALERCLDERRGDVIALGAGHSSVLRDDLAPRVAAALEPFRHVVMLLPSLDPDEAVEILRARSREDRGSPWVLDGTDMIDFWVRDPRQRALATDVVVTAGLSADEVAERVISTVTSPGTTTGG